MRINARLCIRCRGIRSLCKRPTCPILTRFKFQVAIAEKLSEATLLGATPPEVLVGSKLWPKVTIGPLLTPFRNEDARKLGDPMLLYGKSLDEIVALRSQLVRSVFRLHVKRARKPSRLLDLTREMGIAGDPVDAEALFDKPPKPRLRFDDVLAPSGMSGRLSDLKIVGNVSAPRKVESLVNDYDVKVSTAMQELYRANISNYYIARLLSVGVLGVAKDRLIVPSRWSITATDSVLSNYLAKKIVDFDELGEVQVFSQTYVGNRYEILLAPGPLSYEMVEIWLPDSVYMPKANFVFIGSDHETWRGKRVFSKAGGGYYAMKLPVYEYLYKIKRQAFAFALREVTPDYYITIGSWKMREALRSGFKQPPKTFGSVVEALKDISSRIATPFGRWFRRARLLRSYLTQTKMIEFIDSLKS
jgi:hypothetical protein